MRDQNIRNKFKDGELEIYQSVRALEKLINSALNGKTATAREALTEIKEDLVHDFEPGNPDEFFAAICDPPGMAALLQVLAQFLPPTPRSRAWVLTAQAYLNKFTTLC
jgi:hypothetical protein